MNLNPHVLLRVVAVLMLSLLAGQAQEQRRPGGPEGRAMPAREGGVFRMNPIAAALDANTNGVIEASEIANAAVALKKLDKNGDGQLTEDELRPATTGGAALGAGTVDATQIIARLMEFDKNGDGKLSKDELPERMQAFFDRGDADKDGFLTKDEIKKVATERSSGGPGRGERPTGAGTERPPQRAEPNK